MSDKLANIKDLDDMIRNLKGLGKNDKSAGTSPVDDELSVAQTLLNQAPPPPSPIRDKGPVNTSNNRREFKTNIVPLNDHDNSERPIPPPRSLKKSRSETQLKAAQTEVSGSTASLEGPEEIDMSHEHDDESHKVAEAKRKAEAQRMSQYIKFEKASASDFKDLDALLKELDEMYVKKKRQDPSNNHEAESVSNKLQPPPRNTVAQNLMRPLAREQSIPELHSSGSTEALAKPNPDTNQADRDPQKLEKANDILNAAEVMKVAVRIYIENAKTFKTLILNSLMPASQVCSDLVRKAHLSGNDEWALFELINEYAIERPLRSFEIVTDVLTNWEEESINALMIKKYDYADTLTIEGTRTGYPRMCGMLYLEVKTGKWIKRYCELRPKAIHHSKDSKGTNGALLCFLDQYDVYTLLRPRTKCPTKFCFALKFQGKREDLMKDAEYVYFLAADNAEKFKDWILSIRTGKGQRLLDSNPEIEGNSGENKYGLQSGLKKAVSMNDVKKTEQRYDITKFPTAPRIIKDPLQGQDFKVPQRISPPLSSPPLPPGE